MPDVSFGSEADIDTRPPDVRFASDSGQGGLCGPRKHVGRARRCLRRATSGQTM